MLRVKGQKEYIEKFLKIIEEEANERSTNVPSLNDMSSNADKSKGYMDLYCEENYPLDFIETLSNELPELKIQGERYDAAWNLYTFYISKSGSGYLDKVETRLLDISMRLLETESWWDKDDLFYTEEKADGTLSISEYHRWDEQLRIPEQINGKKVTELADELFFMNPALSDLYIGDNIEAVGPKTFTSCRNLLLHTDNQRLIDELKNKRVMIVTSEDSEETERLKRNFVYKASGKGITVYSYRGSDNEVIIPEEIERLPVKKVAQKAFFGRKMKQVVFPSSITEFVPEIFEKGEAEYLVAPGIDFAKVKSIIWKQSLAKGFLLSNQDDIYTDAKIKDAYVKYLKSSISQYMEPCTDDVRLLRGLLEAVKVSPANYEDLLQYAAKKNNLEAKAMLLEYKNSKFSEEDFQKYEERKLFAQDRQPSLSKLKKDWGYKIKTDGTITILSYRGNDTDVIVPSEIEGKPVAEIAEEAFSGVCYYADSKVIINMKMRRQQINSIYIPASVKMISEVAFIGCGDKTLGDKVLQYIYIPKKAKKTYPAKMMLIIEKKSFAEKYAKKENLNYQVIE